MSLPEIFKSKRFQSAVVGLVVTIISSLVPSLEQHLNAIVPAVVAIVGILITGYSAEDVATAVSAKPTVAVSTEPIVMTTVESTGTPANG